MLKVLSQVHTSGFTPQVEFTPIKGFTCSRCQKRLALSSTRVEQIGESVYLASDQLILMVGETFSGRVKCFFFGKKFSGIIYISPIAAIFFLQEGF